MKKHLDAVLAPICIFVISIATYIGLFKSYFEQDEWAVYADMRIFSSYSFIEKLKFLTMTSSMFSHFTPVTTVVSFLSFIFFKLNFNYYAFMSICLHTLLCIMLYVIAKKLVKNNLLALLIALVFCVHKLSSQSVTWIAASLGSQLSTLFFLLSIYLFIRYLERKKALLYVISLVFYIFSFLSKETSITLCIVYPLIHVYLFKPKSFTFKTFFSKEYRRGMYYFLTIPCIFICKYLLSFINPHPQPSAFAGHSSYLSILIKCLLYPIESLSQQFDFGGYITQLAREFYTNTYLFLNSSVSKEKIIETYSTDLISLLLSLCLIVILFFLYWYYKENKIRTNSFINLLFGSLICYFASILPYVLLPKFTGFLEPRYYYTPQIFGAFFTVLFLYMSLYIFLRKHKIVMNVTLIIIISLLLFGNWKAIQNELTRKSDIAFQRKAVLRELDNFRYRFFNTNRTVVYITGNGPDYLIPELKVPFQSGFGNILMAYFDNPSVPAELFSKGFLYQLDDQGYKEVRGKGFGYYYLTENLLTDIKAEIFPVDAIYAFYYDYNTKLISEITDNVRKEISADTIIK